MCPDPETEAPAPTTWAHQPRVRSLTQRQIECVVLRNHLARVAFVSDYRIELRPVHYVYHAGALYGRTSFDTIGLTWLVRPEVVVEVDEVEGLFEWRSIIVRGRVSLLRPAGPPAESIAYWTAVDAIRTLIPGALTERDPTPYRDVVFRIDPDEMTGREASTH